MTAKDNDTYVGAGTYGTDDGGTVVLPAPSENVTVTVEASEGGETATTTADLTPPPTGPFGRIVSTFVETLKSAGFSGPLGQQVSDFVTSNNPSNENANANASERGPPEDAGPGNESDGNETRVVPSTPPTESPGNSGDAPGQSDGNESSDAPGNSGDAPGQSEEGDDESSDAPGNSGDAPGQSDEGDDESDESPGNSGDTPGQSGDEEADEEDESDEDTSDDGGDAGDNGNAGGNGNGGGNGNAGSNGR
ncbi:hypothetical protein [Haloplanus salilacus]|uniref:hypothetical protein n=1 Tax=Haloplanus salilacus TaxID=2949994 RepID=UPI0030CB7A1A